MTRRCALLLLVLASPVVAQTPPAELAVRAQALFKTYCHACHKGPGSEGGNFDFLDLSSLTTRPPEGEKPVLIPGKAAESKVWQRAGVNKRADGTFTMPPKGIEKRPSLAELASLKAWIDAGAPPYAAVAVVRNFVSEVAVLELVHKDLQATDPEDQPYRRYLSLANLHNNKERVSDAALLLARAALSKVLNSLHWKPRLVLPRALDPEGVVFAIDLRDFDWDLNDAWDAVEVAYPYGLRLLDTADPVLRGKEAYVLQNTRAKVPVVRADWFIATATQPPLYHTFLGIPERAITLEKQLLVDVARNYQRGRLARAGFTRSGVSEQNRLIERHDAAHGAYWKSYDFKPRNSQGDLKSYPLGPKPLETRYPGASFAHDGGEIIFNLPNGMQAYMLIDGQGNRIDAGPEEVVTDANKTSGSVKIVNGLSCMACHDKGMKVPPADEIRTGNRRPDDERRRIDRLYPVGARMTQLLTEDTDRYFAAVEKAVGPFQQVGADRDRPVRDLAEPIGETARHYLRDDVDLFTAAAELGLEKVADLKTRIENNPELKRLGLATLPEGGLVKRTDWESGANSLMQRVARELSLGLPYRRTGR
jgi:serine/threonine-protein kinase